MGAPGIPSYTACNDNLYDDVHLHCMAASVTLQQMLLVRAVLVLLARDGLRSPTAIVCITNWQLQQALQTVYILQSAGIRADGFSKALFVLLAAAPTWCP